MNDLRFKLTESDRNEIRRLWNNGLRNYTQLGLMFKVHARTIKRVIDPEFKKKCNEFNRENWRRYAPTKAHHAELIRNYRRRKKIKNNA